MARALLCHEAPGSRGQRRLLQKLIGGATSREIYSNTDGMIFSPGLILTLHR